MDPNGSMAHIGIKDAFNIAKGMVGDVWTDMKGLGII
jgi:hypothetical protein